MDPETAGRDMPSRRLRNAASVLVLLAIFITAVSQTMAQDWPQWRGSNRDGKVAGFAAPQDWPAELTQKWKVTVGSSDATPALVGDKLYVFARQGDEQVMMCLNTANGEELWRHSHGAPQVTGGARQHPGPRSSPAVADGKVVTLGVGGVVSCYDAASGNLLWRKDPFPKVVPQFFTGMSPMIIDGMAILYVGGQGNGAVIAYNLANGEEKWRWAGEAPEYSSPVLLMVGGVKQIVTLSEKGLLGLGAADGTLLWKVSYPSARMSNNVATPIIEGQTVFYGAANRGCHAVKIEKTADGFVTRPLWSNPDVDMRFSTPVLKGMMLFGISGRGNLYCVDAITGKTAWTDGTSRDQMGFAGIVDAGRVLLALPSNSELIVFKPDRARFTQVRSYKVSDAQTYAHPVISGNRIFIKDEDSLTMWTVD